MKYAIRLSITIGVFSLYEQLCLRTLLYHFHYSFTLTIYQTKMSSRRKIHNHEWINVTFLPRIPFHEYLQIYFQEVNEDTIL